MKGEGCPISCRGEGCPIRLLSSLLSFGFYFKTHQDDDVVMMALKEVKRDVLKVETRGSKVDGRIKSLVRLVAPDQKYSEGSPTRGDTQGK